MHGKKNRSSLARNLGDLAGCVDTVQERHDKINYSDGGLKLPSQPDCVAAIRSLTDHVEAFALEESFQALAHHQMIID